LPTETPDERRAALDGWICMPISAKRMMSDLVAHGSGELSFEVFVQTKPSGYQCVYD